MAARVLVLPLTGVASVVSSRIVADSSGSMGFAWFSLLITLPMLIPVSDFGISAVLTDDIARHGLSSPEFKATLGKTLKMLGWIAAVTVICAIGIGLCGGWTRLLGIPASILSEVACVLIVTFMAIGIPLGAAQRILLGVGKQSRATLVMGLGAVVSLGLVAGLHVAGTTEFGLYALGYIFGPLASQLVIGALAASLVRRHSVPGGPTEATGSSLHGVAFPMAVIAIALPLAYQSDRVFLAHFSTTAELAEYSIVAVLYAPLLSVITVSGQTLWPMFLKHMTSDARQQAYSRAQLLFVLLGVVSALGLLGVGPWISRFIGQEAGIEAPSRLYILFALLLLMFAIHTPNGMLLMNARGRRIQAIGAMALLFAKIPLSLLLIPIMGASGVLAGTIAAASLCLVLPAWIMSRRMLRDSPTHLIDVN